MVQYLHLVNSIDRPVAYKVKTTAPTRYNVKPFCGVVTPSGMCSIMIAMQPLFGSDGIQTGSGSFDRNKQKFLLQSLIVSSEFMKQQLSSKESTRAVLELVSTA